LRGEKGAHDGWDDDDAREEGERRLQSAPERSRVETPRANLRGGDSGHCGDREQQARFHRGATAYSEEEPSRKGPFQGQLSREQHDQGAEPKGSPEVVGAVFQRAKKPPRQERDEDGGPQPRAPGKNPAPDVPHRPERHEPKRHHRKAHESQNIRPLAERGDQGGEEDVKERRVIVEEIAVLQQSLRPAPGGVEVLRFVAVVTETEDVEAAQYEGGQEQEGDGPAFGARDRFATLGGCFCEGVGAAVHGKSAEG